MTTQMDEAQLHLACRRANIPYEAPERNEDAATRDERQATLEACVEHADLLYCIRNACVAARIGFNFKKTIKKPSPTSRTQFLTARELQRRLNAITAFAAKRSRIETALKNYGEKLRESDDDYRGSFEEYTGFLSHAQQSVKNAKKRLKTAREREQRARTALEHYGCDVPEPLTTENIPELQTHVAALENVVKEKQLEVKLEHPLSV
eukprot:CAMPEP_0198645158 /NCGR_PEP_ID=MMETSP1467-20131203/1092_1 /TAXON_ID=1462469 /ORGANISM="unid. sp., Strain CCMP2135" /LENGTH=206 /DNA_ID=CAMNT_0044380643 /DNA_START=57 /DNA_END=677 /DNA_ORIENTATION=+